MRETSIHFFLATIRSWLTDLLLSFDCAMNYKALARFLYASVPGLAAVRFAAKDLLGLHFVKREFEGILHLPIGDGLIVDVGANRGQSTAAIKILAPRAKITAFEPEPESVKRLTRRYFRDETVVVHSCALGDRSGTITFFVPKYGWWNCDGMAATSRKEATEWLRDPNRMFHFNETKLEVKEHLIECRTLDSYELSPVAIKLHAQGSELEILRGSIETIRQHWPVLMCAFPTSPIIEWLAALGYRPYRYANRQFVPGTAKRPTTFTWFLT